MGTGGIIAIDGQRDKDVEEPALEDLYWVGTSARVLRVHHEDEDTLHVVVQGQAHSLPLVRPIGPYILARVEASPVEDQENLEIAALVRSIKQMAGEIVELIPELPSGAADLVNQIESPSRLAYMIPTHLVFRLKTDEVLQQDDVRGSSQGTQNGDGPT